MAPSAEHHRPWREGYPGDLRRELGNLDIVNVPTGTDILDWTVPQEWWVNDAWIKTPDGRKICRFKAHNLHLLNSSVGIHEHMSLEELDKHLYSLPTSRMPFRTVHHILHRDGASASSIRFAKPSPRVSTRSSSTPATSQGT